MNLRNYLITEKSEIIELDTAMLGIFMKLNGRLRLDTFNLFELSKILHRTKQDMWKRCVLGYSP